MPLQHYYRRPTMKLSDAIGLELERREKTVNDDFLPLCIPENAAEIRRMYRAQQVRIEALENDIAYHSELCTIQQAKISELKAKQRWIPVSECLPPSSYGLPRSSAVLVYTPTIKCMFTATYDYDRGLWQHFGRSSCEICEEVSHWMSLPEPPQ